MPISYLDHVTTGCLHTNICIISLDLAVVKEVKGVGLMQDFLKLRIVTRDRATLGIHFTLLSSPRVVTMHTPLSWVLH